VSAPRWRQAYDAAERAITPRAENLVRTPAFALAVALLRRGRSLARGSVQDVTAGAWHLLNLPAGSDISRLRTQVGSLDREVRRLTVQLENERRRNTGTHRPEERDAIGPQPADDPRPRPARRRTQRPPGT